MAESSINEQSELFDTWNTAPETRKSSALLVPSTTITLHLGYEHVVVVAVAMMMGLVAAFALGLDRGQRIVQHTPAIPTPAKEAPRRTLASTAGIAVATPAPAPAVKVSASPTAAPTTTAVPRSRYAIQIASYRKSSQASAEASRLKRQGHATVSTANRGEFTIVLVGSYASKQEATRELSTWRKRYKDCFVKELQRESTS